MATSKQTSIHTHVCNAVSLVWGLLRLVPITPCTTTHPHTCVHKQTCLHTQHQVRFGELPSTDSEDFFSAIAKFIGQFKKVTLEMFPPPKPPKPRCAANMYLLMCGLMFMHARVESMEIGH